MSSRLMVENKLFDRSTALRIEPFEYEAEATHQLSRSDADWLLELLNTAPVDDNFTLKSVYLVTVLDPVRAESFSPDQKQRLFDSGKRILAESPAKDFMRLTGGLKLLEKSGDKRGIAIAKIQDNVVTFDLLTSDTLVSGYGRFKKKAEHDQLSVGDRILVKLEVNTGNFWWCSFLHKVQSA